MARNVNFYELEYSLRNEAMGDVLRILEDNQPIGRVCLQSPPPSDEICARIRALRVKLNGPLPGDAPPVSVREAERAAHE